MNKQPIRIPPAFNLYKKLLLRELRFVQIEAIPALPPKKYWYGTDDTAQDAGQVGVSL